MSNWVSVDVFTLTGSEGSLKYPYTNFDIMAVTEILDFPPSQKPKHPSRLLYKNSSSPNSFQQAMKPPLVLMQFFGFFPVKGITSSNYRDLKFKWLSWRVLQWLVFLMGNSFHFVCYCAKRKIDKMLVLNAVLFYSEALLLSVLFLNLAKQWPRFVKEWHMVEVAMKNYELSINIKRKMSIIIVAILALATVEHTMVTANNVLASVKDFPNNRYGAIKDFFISHSFPEIYSYVPYSMWSGIFFQFLILQETFMWTFIDIFIILISICLNFRLQQISKKLSLMSKIEVSNENLWRNIREDYIKLFRLCELTNKQLSWLIIISYFSNIYHILSQLFSSLRPIEDIFHKIYFYVSFFLLILRVTSVCIFGGAVYDEHEHITRILTTVPSAAYNIEVERFVIHLATCETALTGKNFFKITRNLILKVTSAIVTYELVLIQFNQQEFKTKDL